MGNIAVLFSILVFLATLVSESFAAPAPVPQPQGLPPTNDGIFPICHCAQLHARKQCCYGGEWGKNCTMMFDSECAKSEEPPHLPSGIFTQALGVNTTFMTSTRTLYTPAPLAPPKITWKWPTTTDTQTVSKLTGKPPSIPGWPSTTDTHTVSVLTDTIWPIPGLPTTAGTQTISKLAHTSSFSPSPLILTDTRTVRVPTVPVTSIKSRTGRSSIATHTKRARPYPDPAAIPTPPIGSTVPRSVTTLVKDPFITVTTLAKEPFITVTTLAKEPFITVTPLAKEPFITVTLVKDPVITVTPLAKEPIFSASVLAPSPSPSLVKRGVEEVVEVVRASPKDNTTSGAVPENNTSESVSPENTIIISETPSPQNGTAVVLTPPHGKIVSDSSDSCFCDSDRVGIAWCCVTDKGCQYERSTSCDPQIAEHGGDGTASSAAGKGDEYESLVDGE